jgi:hypothetical protein
VSHPPKWGVPARYAPFGAKVRVGSKAVLQPCRLQCPVCPKADIGRLSARYNPVIAAIRLTAVMEYAAWSFGLDVGCADHLAPLLGFRGTARLHFLTVRERRSIPPVPMRFGLRTGMPTYHQGKDASTCRSNLASTPRRKKEEGPLRRGGGLARLVRFPTNEAGLRHRVVSVLTVLPRA